MKELISKELLKSVFDSIDEQKSYITYGKCYYYDIYSNHEVHELTNFIPDFQLWASQKHDFVIASYFSKIDNGWFLEVLDVLPYGMELPEDILEELFKTPYEPVFAACQWIFDNYRKLSVH